MAIASSRLPEYVRRPLTAEEERNVDFVPLLCDVEKLTAILCQAFIMEGTAVGYVYGHVDQDAPGSRRLHEGAIFRSKVLSFAVPLGRFWLLCSEEERFLVLSWEESLEYATSVEDGVEYIDPEVALTNRQWRKGFRL
ncbi:hypothetical protein [Pseudomonas japonica]|uniref:hypothetical protein n=1 Tax=Pseudomonas japonica TaxID=256466 RepID=UPI0015E309A9|nr:hypothetical protein [Pseudomonas japonica]MBA1244939.1 hypothetical protein [Pseudomonas japonica]